jgi:beta-barrel assembly-enhancing protease
MRYAILALAFVLTASPGFAQIGGLSRAVRKADETKDRVDKIRDMIISDADERKIGELVSERVRREFGVYQDAEVTRYVALVGTVLAQASTRPELAWEFIVLDTDGVNAFASPGGIVLITRGALGMIKSEAELAGVLGHEIAHIAGRHTVNAIKKSKGIELLADVTPGSNALFEGLANLAYDNIVEKGFDRADEADADEKGIRLANAAGYDPSGLGTFLTKLAERNAGQGEVRNGLFASHPETKGRISSLGKQIRAEKLAAAATVEARYASHITWDVVDLASIEAVLEGTRGLAGGGGGDTDKKADDKADDKAEEGRKPRRGFGIGPLNLSGKQAESTQASASAGNRAVGRDRLAQGGPNPSKLTLPPLTPAELEAFKKGIAG